VKQLRALGAQVFPPGDKEGMDWGVLAGVCDPCVCFLYATLLL
jgi:hypothetical protein